MNNLMKTILGIYKHYKGNLYQVIGFARHTETQEELAVYHSLTDKTILWARPIVIFEENVHLDGRNVPRFSHISET